ncbi:hypothetical protein MTR_5g022890 [Medicago truncatula]|uniref:Uncharacterized protein n=1 Tax=Medicago truncatula TaxID=3880 RepID=G7JXN0_MEDTR|nr:hypothetical protein MTR_5g022890 [Medicago truncatula]
MKVREREMGSGFWTLGPLVRCHVYYLGGHVAPHEWTGGPKLPKNQKIEVCFVFKLVRGP